MIRFTALGRCFRRTSPPLFVASTSQMRDEFMARVDADITADAVALADAIDDLSARTGCPRSELYDVARSSLAAGTSVDEVHVRIRDLASVSYDAVRRAAQ